MNETQNPGQSLSKEVAEDVQKTAPVADAEVNVSEEAAKAISDEVVPEPTTIEVADSNPVTSSKEEEKDDIVAPSPTDDEAEPAAPALQIKESKPQESTMVDDEAQIDEEESFIASVLPGENETEEKEASFKYTHKATKAEIIDRLKEILSGEPEKVEKQELDALKQNFYKLHKAWQAAERKAFADDGGNPDEFVPTPDTEEEEYKSLMNIIKERRSTLQEEEQQALEKNLAEKLQIIERLKFMVENANMESASYNEFKTLQQRWKEIKEVPQAKANELWKKYQLYTERFYDILKLNNEFREYDFKKNLEIKTRLCEEAEKLAGENDLIAAFRKLQKLHQEWRETGPVSRELREEIWGRFKAASSVINRQHQQHFEEIKEIERNNLDQKTVICEIVEGIEFEELTSYRSWNDKTKEVIALQAKWKTIGFAPQKMNLKIFERFRSACDEFFRRKGEFFKGVKVGLTDNLTKKRELCEKAEALKESTEWKETAAALTELQKEWKSIGPVPKKFSDALWKQFIGACDYFFEQKGKVMSSQYSTETSNLKQKKTIIEKLKEFVDVEINEEIADAVRKLAAEWNSIGFVPFKEKDKINKEYHELTDKLFGKLHISETSRRLSSFKPSGRGGENRERERLSRMYENMKNDIMTYENNIGFLNTSNKKGGNLVAELQQKVEQLKAEAELIFQKIKEFDEGSSNQSGEKE